MQMVSVVHPDLDGVHEVPEIALPHWKRSGWRPVVDESAEENTEPAQASAPETPTPRRRRSKEGE